MKTTSKVILLLAVVFATLTLSYETAGKAHAVGPQTSLEAGIVLTAYSQVGVRETSTNFVRGKQYAQFHDEWCADFVRWVMGKNGISPTDSGRTRMANTYRVARAWAYNGAIGGGWVRSGKTNDAMPGDLLIDHYNGTPTAGGHISIVVETNIGGHRNLVKTVGGNESNAVRLSEKDLNDNGRYLVTLAELRVQKQVMANGAVVAFERFQSPFGAALQIKAIAYEGKLYTGQYQLAGFALAGTNITNGRVELKSANDPIPTEIWRNIYIARAGVTMPLTLN
jgi:hypothetical protein